MGTYSNLRALFTAIANAIRTKTGGSSEIVANNFPEAIEAIPTGTTPTGTININVTNNGQSTHDVSSYANAWVNVAVPNSYNASDEGKVVSNGSLVAQTALNILLNGTYNTTQNNSVTVNVPAGYGVSYVYRAIQRDLSSKTITFNNGDSATLPSMAGAWTEPTYPKPNFVAVIDLTNPEIGSWYYGDMSDGTSMCYVSGRAVGANGITMQQLRYDYGTTGNFYIPVNGPASHKYTMVEAVIDIPNN